MNYHELLQSPIIPPQIATLALKAAHHIAPVLIQGEEGTGKEQIAKTIHYAGDWKDYRFYKMDCRILTEDTFHAQLSHLFKEIRYGTVPATLFLKEVGSLGHQDQLKLLELIEDGLFQNDHEKKIVKNIRFISSSSENLKEKVAQRKFSEDLYYQLNTFSIFVPPLRDRTKELSLIARFILEEYSKKMKVKKVGIPDEVIRLLESYWWPGNLREFEHVMVQSAIYSEGKDLIQKDFFFKQEDGESSLFSFLKRAEMKTFSATEKGFSEDPKNLPVSTLFIELVHRIKNPLVSIKTFTQLLRHKFNDAEFRDQFYRVVTEDIEKIDSLLNGLLDYIKINTPIEKTNTVHLVLEDVLEKHGPQIKEKQIKIFKKYELNLPETTLHQEQLRYIFSSLLQYAISFLPQKGSIGFLTKSLNSHKETSTDEFLLKEDRGYIEIFMVFTGYKKPNESFEDILGIPASQETEATELELRLIKEIIQKNRGMMKLEVNEEKPRTLISLRFPIERRRIIYYLSANS